MNRLCWHIADITILFLILHGCIVDETLLNSGEKPVPGGDENICFNLSVRTNSYSIPLTRTTLENETTIEKIWVLVFEGVGENAVFVDTATVHITGRAMTGMNGTVTLRRRAATCQLLFLANLPENIGNNTDNNTVDVSTLEKLKDQFDGLSTSEKTLKNISDNILLTSKLDGPQTTVPYRNMALPMSRLVEMKYGIGTSSSENSIEVSFKRSVAKIVVERMPKAWTSNNNFWIGGIVAVMNVPNQGRIHQLDSDELMFGSDINYLSSWPYLANAVEIDINEGKKMSTENEPIYLYETGSNNTISFIIRASWQNVQYYYKLTMTDNEEAYVPLRNYEYIFQIVKADGPGYMSIADAMASQASNTNLDYTIQVIDIDAYEVMGNNNYYLGVSNSVFIAYTTPGDEGTDYDEAFKLITDCKIEFPDAKTIKDNRENVGSSFELISPVEIPVVTGSSSDPVITSVGVKVKDGLMNNEGIINGDDKNAYITLELGNIKKKVHIRQRPAISSAGATLYFAPTDNDDPQTNNVNYNCLSGYVEDGVDNPKDWIKLLPSLGMEREVTDSIIVEDGEIQIKIDENKGTSRRGVVYLTTTSALGENVGQRIKIDITQLGQ